MNFWPAWGSALLACVLFALPLWAVSVARKNASIVDLFWAVFFMLAASVFAGLLAEGGPRQTLVLALVWAWGLRLSIYLTLRNWGHGEDRRYQVIRANNQPNFALKSLYLIFIFQAVLAWIIAAPLAGAIEGDAPISWLDALGVAVWAVGFCYESIADWQMARFKANPANAGKGMDRGLWRHTRHPNYFGESVLWWGFWLLALSAGAGWTVFAPLLITWMLIKFSGVALLEKDIHERRPAYADYIARTPAFIPGPRKTIPPPPAHTT